MNYNKTKTLLKLSNNRLKQAQQKKSAILKTARKEIATLIENNKLESARIKCELIIREDYTIEALELLELYTDTLLARFGLLEQMRYCDPASIFILSLANASKSRNP
jgi:vacuolar protein sorting-associated protein IST1